MFELRNAKIYPFKVWILQKKKKFYVILLKI